jgi:hypothetical protein
MKKLFSILLALMMVTWSLQAQDQTQTQEQAQLQEHLMLKDGKTVSGKKPGADSVARAA